MAMPVRPDTNVTLQGTVADLEEQKELCRGCVGAMQGLCYAAMQGLCTHKPGTSVAGGILGSPLSPLLPF